MVQESLQESAHKACTDALIVANELGKTVFNDESGDTCLLADFFYDFVPQFFKLFHISCYLFYVVERLQALVLEQRETISCELTIQLSTLHIGAAFNNHHEA